MITKKKKLLKTIVIFAIIIFISVFPIVYIMNKIYNDNSDDIIKVVVYLPDSRTTYYVEVKPNGVIVSWKGKREPTSEFSENDKSSFFVSKITNAFRSQRIRVSKNTIDDIFNLADKTIIDGNIEGKFWFDSYCCEMYYKGFSHKIYTALDGYDDLYRLLNKIMNSLPRPIKIDTMIESIEEFK